MFQSYGRIAHPRRIDGSQVVVGVASCAKLRLPCPQKSPPDARLSTAAFGMTPPARQSTWKLLFASVHVRWPLDVVRRFSGLVVEPVIELPSAAARYLPTFTFSAVLPLPKTSYATPPRGEMSLYLVPSVCGSTVGTTMNGLGPIVCSGKKLDVPS